MPAGTGWLHLVALLNPVSYGVEAIRSSFAPTVSEALSSGYLSGVSITVLFSAVLFAISVRLVAKRSRRG